MDNGRIFCVPECRHPSYAELDGIQVKISEKYRFSETSFMQQVNCHCVSINHYQYDYENEYEYVKGIDIL